MGVDTEECRFEWLVGGGGEREGGQNCAGFFYFFLHICKHYYNELRG